MSGPPRVLHVLGGTAPGGIETWLLRIMPALRAAGVRTDLVVHGGPPGAYQAAFERLGCAILTGPDPQRPWAYGASLAALIARNGPYDIVHGQLYLLNGLVMRVATNAGVPRRLAHLHPYSDIKARRPGRWLYRRLMTHWLARHATALLFPSHSSATAALPGLAHLPSHVIPNCILPEQYAPGTGRSLLRRQLGLPETGALVVSLGRFVPHKDHATAVAIIDRLRLAGRTVYLVLAGAPGPSLEGLRRLVAGQPHIQLLVGLDETAPLLCAADAFLFPSREEGFGVVALEAQAAGLPVVASALPALREALAPELHEFTFPVGDVGAGAAALERILDDRALSEHLAQAGRAWAQRFSVAASVQALLRVYGAPGNPDPAG